MNYVAIQLISYFSTIWENPKGSGHIGVITSGRFPKLFGQHYILNIIIVIVITVAMYVYLKYSKHGYEIDVVGQSENTARYIGINVKKVIIRTMAVSGAICGIAGLLLVGGTDHTITANTAGGQGFTAIMVTWLAKFNPIYMILTTFLIVFLESGASEVVSKFSGSLNGSYADILTGIVLFFIIGSEFFLRYQIKFRKKHEEVN
jgi:simple sugar transport system permease protein